MSPSAKLTGSLSRTNAGALEHVLASQVSAAEGRQLGVAHLSVHSVGILRRHGGVFGIAAVAAVTDVINVGEAVVVAVVVAPAQVIETFNAPSG